MLRKQGEFAEAHMVGQHLEGYRSEPFFGSPDLEEALLGEVLFVKIALERLIPRPARHDVRPQGGSLGLEGEVDVVSAVAERGKE